MLKIGKLNMVAGPRTDLNRRRQPFSGLLTDNAKAFRISAGVWCNGSYWKLPLGLNGMI